MSDFLKFVAEKVKDFPMHVEISYSRTCDWTIYIFNAGCSRDYPKAMCVGDDVVIVHEQDCDLQYCCAKAHVALKDWLMEFDGGY